MTAPHDAAPSGIGEGGGPADDLKALLSQTDLPYRWSEESGGFHLGVRAQKVDVDPVLIAGDATVWLLVPVIEGDFGSAAPSRIRALEIVNRINASIPFGICYVEPSAVVFRNTIRIQSLRHSNKELNLFVVVSMGILDEVAGFLDELR